ncbi:MAG: Holliday junction branch migration protein RuvA [Clostridiales bacterium]|nr:Holliday junction branch migration protein RuvA [Clostridiales bacterium]
MYAYIRGVLAGKEPDAVVVEAAGVGYRILAGSRMLASLPPLGKEVKVYTYLNIRDDAHILYGFLDSDEKEMFRRLITISGIGPKVAMSILSGLTPAELALAVVTDDVRSISRVNGVGKKTAERLILELKGSIGNEELISGSAGTAQNAPQRDSAREAIEALMALGYTSAEAARAVSQMPESVNTVEQIIVHALRQLDRG